jgi:hypothetical protein
MKTKIFILSLFSFVVFSFNSFGQIKDIANTLVGSTSDANKILQEYLKPYANAFGADMNAAWYNTAKVHKLLGFDLTFSVSTCFVPKADKEFDASTLGLTGTVTSGTSPTIAGKNNAGQTISYFSNTFKYSLPNGTGWGVVPSPMLQLGLGLVKGTDITVRYIPDLNIGDFGKFGLWGVGVKHSIKQWIPAIKLMPFFHLSVFMGYSQLKMSSDLSLTSTDITDNSTATITDNSSSSYNDQKMEMTFKSFNANVIASLDLPVITLYGSAGFATNNTNLALKGTYPVLANGTTISTITDPIDLKMNSSSGTKPRITGGIKFKMAVITFHVDYTYANYSLVTTGLGISFR